jgi:ABC-type sugar transport system permease subunit
VALPVRQRNRVPRLRLPIDRAASPAIAAKPTRTGPPDGCARRDLACRTLVAFLLLPGLASIPRERWEDATIDGVSWLGKIRNVALPALRPLILAVTMLLLGGALATFDSILTMTGGGPGTETVTPALYSYNKAFTFSAWPIGAASGWLIGGAVLLAGLAYLRLSRNSYR